MKWAFITEIWYKMLPKSDLPLDRDAAGRYLPWLVAFMVYLAVLALAGAILAHETAAKWDRGLAGRLTVQVLPSESGGQPLDAQVHGALSVLLETPGVIRAEALGQDEIDRLLAPWLGEVDKQDLPVPALIAVTLDDAFGVDLVALAERLQAAVPGAMLDDHQRWLAGMLALARMIELLALGIVALVIGAAVITVVFVTRTGLSIHAQVIELLHLIGAHDSYIAGQFQLQALRIGLRGGLGGLLPAMVTLLLLWHLILRADAELLQDLAPGAAGWALVVAPPLGTALVAMITARLTVLRALAKMP